MLTFLLICILFCTVLGLASAVYSYLALKGSAEHADLAASHERAATKAAERAVAADLTANGSANKAERHKIDAELARDHASGHADDAALALGEMKPETVTIVDKRTGEPLFSYPEIERDCE